MSAISEHFQKVESELLIQAQQAGILGQARCAVGSAREKFVDVFLQRHLPQTASIGTGVILDFDDNRSNQVDTIIYSAAMPKIIVANQGAFLRESVFATIETKSYLNKAELERSLISIKSFKGLKIASRQYTPIIATANGKGYTWEQFYEGRAASYIFGYDGLKLDTLMSHLTSFGKDSDSLDCGPDLIGVLNQGIISRNDGQFLPKREDSGQFVTNALPHDVLVLLFIHLLNTISSFGVLPYDFRKYLSFGDLNRIRGS
ncbi:MAG: hypothetical protein HY673_05930 [Chloroflexi bacterium]|nr:hypothetical protein [Chloroflexota bacterium]